MKLKVCGISDLKNLKAIDALGVDYIGYNFYGPSKRYVGDDASVAIQKTKAERFGVFVKEDYHTIVEKADTFGLTHIQFHGDESPSFCRQFASEFHLVKVFRIDEEFDFETLKPFEFCDYFLFDTKVSDFGGSGQKFDWNILNQYVENIPFFLSGGIEQGDAERILSISHPMLYGLDINSKFESSPGIKQVEQVASFLNKISKPDI